MAASTKVLALLAAVLVALVAATAAVRVLEEEEAVQLGSLAPAPAPAMANSAGAIAPGAWAVAAVVSLLAFLAN
ncbi:hypothetical protein ABZP36_027276 [Zizania latifolia]